MVARTSGTAGRVRVYLARHGQTPLNESGVLRGLADPPLDETGREQASRLGAVLGPRNPSLVVASPLQRAIQTAQPVADRAGLAVVRDKCLVDRDYGRWTGAPKESVIARWGSVDNAPGVEPVLVILVRAMTGLNAITSRCREGTVVVAVSHDAVNRQVLAALCPDLGDPDSIPQDNGCFNTLEWRDGTWTVLAINEIPSPADETAAGLSSWHELGGKRAVLLVQLPPGLPRDDIRLAYFLQQIPEWLRVAVEFRHPSWHCEETFALLEEHRAGYCVTSGANLPCVLRATADFVYVRMHGPDHHHLYAGSYSDADLMWWADRIREWSHTGREVLVYFNNDGDANAVRNARALQALVLPVGAGRPDARSAAASTVLSQGGN